MTFALYNKKDGILHVGDLVFQKGETKNEEYITRETLNAVNAGDLTCSPSIATLAVEGDLENTLATLTDSSTGTAATITAGAATIAAVTVVADAANAIATLTVQQNLTKTLLTNLINRVEVLQKLSGL